MLQKLQSFFDNIYKVIGLSFIAIIILITVIISLYQSQNQVFKKSVPAKASEDIFYVDPNGDNNNPGTVGAPFKTLSKGISVLTAGDTLNVTGTFDTALVINKSGNETQRIKVIGNNYPQIRAGNANLGIDIAGNYVTVSGFELTGGVSHGIYTEKKHIEILNNRVHDSVTGIGSNNNCSGSGSWGSGIKLYVGAEDILIKGNTIYDNCGEGLTTSRGKNVIVEDNVVTDNFSVNIYLDRAPNIIATNNISRCTGRYLRDGLRATGILLGNENYDTGWGSIDPSSIILRDVFVNGNYVEGCRPIRLYNQMSVDPDNITVTNNVFKDVSTPYVKIDGATGVTVSNNVSGTGLPGITQSAVTASPIPTRTSTPVPPTPTRTLTPVSTRTPTPTTPTDSVIPTSTVTPTRVPSLTPIPTRTPTPRPFPTFSQPTATNIPLLAPTAPPVAGTAVADTLTVLRATYRPGWFYSRMTVVAKSSSSSRVTLIVTNFTDLKYNRENKTYSRVIYMRRKVPTTITIRSSKGGTITYPLTKE